MEAEILSEIKEAEKKADETIERAKRGKESLVHEAKINASKLLAAGEVEIRKLQEKKIADFKEKAGLLREEKLAEGSAAAKQIKAKAEKSTAKAVEFILKKFEEMI